MMMIKAWVCKHTMRSKLPLADLQRAFRGHLRQSRYHTLELEASLQDDENKRK
jgi:hypothetical protein